MSGHSKWATTHRQKEVADAKRGAVFTKLANNITVAARQGGGKPESNFKLRLAIEKARATSMPKENIERAIKKGTGELTGESIEQIIYEGFGPGGVAVILEVLTDNRNRTSAAVKHLFLKYGGNLGAPGSVKRFFQQKGLLKVKKLTEGEQLALIDAGAEDIEQKDDGFLIISSPQSLEKIKNILEKIKIPTEYAEVEMVASEKISIIEPAILENLEKFFFEIEDSEDIINYYTNADGF